jgi:hypothetical protein
MPVTNATRTPNTPRYYQVKGGYKPDGYRTEAPDYGPTLGPLPATPSASRDQARLLESSADRDRTMANTQLERARARSRRAAALKTDTGHMLATAEKEREVHAEIVEKLDQARADLQKSGVSEVELRRSIDTQRTLERKRLDLAETDASALREQLVLADLEAKDAETDEKLAETRVEKADQKRKLAAALSTRAERLSRLRLGEYPYSSSID